MLFQNQFLNIFQIYKQYICLLSQNKNLILQEDDFW